MRRRQLSLFDVPVVDRTPQPLLRNTPYPPSCADPVLHGLLDWLSSVRDEPAWQKALPKMGHFTDVVAEQHGNVAALHVAYAGLSDKERGNFWRSKDIRRDLEKMGLKPPPPYDTE